MTHPTGFAGRDEAASGTAAGFTITEALVALGLTLLLTSSFLLLFGPARQSLRLEPEISSMRHDGRAVLDRIAADLLRAGSGLPVEVPVFTDLDRAGDRNPDGLDFLAAPERLVEASFEPVVGFNGSQATLAAPQSRLGGSRRNSWVVVFNDDEMMPRWVFGRVVSVSGSGSGALGRLGSAVRSGAKTAPAPPRGARVRIAPLTDAWHHHFRASVDADTFSPGSGGGLLERGLQSLLGGVIEAALPGAGSSVVSGLTDQVVASMIETLAAKKGKGKKPGSAGGGGEDPDGYGLFGLGQPGIVPVSRIRYWVRAAGAEERGVLMRRVDETPPQPVGFVEDLQVRYLTGARSDVPLDTPPRFAGDLRTAASLDGHIVRAVEISVRIRSVGRRLAAAPGGSGDSTGPFLLRTYRRRVGLRVAAAGVDRRAWEEHMQMNALPTDIPKIGPLRFLRLPW